MRALGDARLAEAEERFRNGAAPAAVAPGTPAPAPAPAEPLPQDGRTELPPAPVRLRRDLVRRGPRAPAQLPQPEVPLAAPVAAAAALGADETQLDARECQKNANGDTRKGTQGCFC